MAKQKFTLKGFAKGFIPAAAIGAAALYFGSHNLSKPHPTELPYNPNTEQKIEQTTSRQGLETKLESPQNNQTSTSLSRQNYRTTDFSTDTDEVLLARMLFGEARNCSEEERIAIAYTAINRIYDGKKWNGTDVRSVILSPWQYSCFIENDPNRKKLMDPQKYDEQSWNACLETAKKVLSEEYSDPTHGATHYFNPTSANPGWKDSMQKIGKIRTNSGLSRHEFYIEN